MGWCVYTDKDAYIIYCIYIHVYIYIYIHCIYILLCGQGLHTRTSWTRPYTTAAESSRAASNQRTWTMYTYWPVSPLLTSGELLPAAWNAHDKRQMPDTNCSITDQLLADWSRGRASCAQSRRSTRLRAAADCGSGKTAWQTCQPPSTWDWRWPSLCRLDLERTGSVGELLTNCTQGGPFESSDEEMGLTRRCPVGGLRLRGATDDGPPPLLPPTTRGLYGWRPGHSDRAGKGMRPQVGEHCVKDTTEEEYTYIYLKRIHRI